MRRSRRLPLFVLALAAPAAFLLVQACSSDSATVPDDTSTPEGGGGQPEGNAGGDASVTPTPDGSTPDAEPDATCVPPPVNLDAGGQCGTVEFALPVAPFGGVDGGEDPYKGGAIPAGVYDVVIAERASGLGGFWHETFVVDGKGRYTRTRQIATSNSDASVGPLTRRSGSYTVAGNMIRLQPDCATSDGEFVDAGVDNLPYEVIGDTCKAPVYRFGATGFRLTFKRR